MQGNELKGEVEGILAMKQSWPSIMRTLFGDHKRYEETYFSAYKVCLLSYALKADSIQTSRNRLCGLLNQSVLMCVRAGVLLHRRRLQT